MSIRELSEWYRYYSEEPFIADRLEAQLATIGYIASSFGGGKSKHEDFMICKVDKKRTSKDLVKAKNDEVLMTVFFPRGIKK